MKLYDLIKSLLTERQDLRDSDKKLIWAVFQELGYATSYTISFSDFTSPSCPSTESIRRCRQKIQENVPELRGSQKVQKLRDDIEDQRGTHIYREETLPVTESLLKLAERPEWKELGAKLHSSKYKLGTSLH